MLKPTMRRHLAVCGLALVLGASCYTAYRAGQSDGPERPFYAGQTVRQNAWQVAQHAKSSGITLRAEQDQDGPYIVVVIPWRTLCASGMKLPQEQAEDCADAKASKSQDLTYILPTDDDNDDTGAPTNRETADGLWRENYQRSGGSFVAAFPSWHEYHGQVAVRSFAPPSLSRLASLQQRGAKIGTAAATVSDRLAVVQAQPYQQQLRGFLSCRQSTVSKSSSAASIAVMASPTISRVQSRS